MHSYRRIPRVHLLCADQLVVDALDELREVYGSTLWYTLGALVAFMREPQNPEEVLSLRLEISDLPRAVEYHENRVVLQRESDPAQFAADLAFALVFCQDLQRVVRHSRKPVLVARLKGNPARAQLVRESVPEQWSVARRAAFAQAVLHQELIEAIEALFPPDPRLDAGDSDRSPATGRRRAQKKSCLAADKYLALVNAAEPHSPLTDPAVEEIGGFIPRIVPEQVEAYRIPAPLLQGVVAALQAVRRIAEDLKTEDKTR